MGTVTGDDPDTTRNAGVEEARGLIEAIAEDARARLSYFAEARFTAQQAGLRAPAIPIGQFDDGCPIYASVLAESPGRVWLDPVPDFAHEHDVALSRRLVRRYFQVVGELVHDGKLPGWRETCAVCGAEFVGRRVGGTRRYCSNGCRQRAYRERRRQASCAGRGDT
jgi:hypothetical protein